MNSDAKKVIGIAQGYADEAKQESQTYTDEIAGNIVEVSVDPSSFLMTLTLKNKDGETLSTDSVDLPLEEMIVSGQYDSQTKTLILTLKSGQVINIPLSDIISGLVTKDYVDGEIERVEGEIPTNLSDLTEDSTHRTVTDAEKTGWNSKADESDIPTTLAELSDDATHRVVTDTEKSAWDAKADTSDIPTTLAELTDDSTHRLVTDTEKSTWDGKADTSDIPTNLADLNEDSTHRVVTDADIENWNNKVDNVTITVTCTATDGVTVTGNTITLRNGTTKDAPVIGTRTYAGQPVTFIVAKDTAYYVQASNFTGHFPVDDVKGVANTDTSILFSFRDYGEVETFADVQTLCRAGVVQDALEIGQTFDMVKDGVTYPVAVMHFIENGESGSIKLKNGLQEGVIFQTVDCPYSAQFDSAEAFHTTEVEYAAGTTLNFTIPSAYSSWAAGTYQFTLAQDTPVGTQFGISGNAGTALTSLYVNVYASADSTSFVEQCAITEGNDGTALGNLNGVANNHPQRISYGNNRWIHSALRQQLNSDAIAGSVWTPQHKWDRPPSWNTSLKGFLNGLSSDVADYIAEVEVDTYRNTVTDGGGLDTSTEKVFLVGRVEEWFLVEGADNGEAWSYYKDGSVSDVPHNGADAIRGKKVTGASANTYWWQRSPHVGTATIVRITNPDGSNNHNYSDASNGVSPAFVIA